jgi:transcriptional regulator GlxA family with amidase domain
MCTGAFVLASTGLLDGKSATTHWSLASTFRAMFPKVKLLDDKIIIDEGGIYTSGGGASSLSLCLYLVEKYCGKEMAILSSKMLLMNFNGYPQLSYSIFFPQTNHDDESIKEAQSLVENSNKKITVEQLADKVSLSKRSFIRRFKASTGGTPVDFIQRMNVENAKRLLETTKKSVEGIIYSLGYRDVTSFRKVFMKHTSLSPREYRKKYERLN